MGLLVSQGQAGKEQMLPYSMSFYRLLAEVVAQMKGVSFCFQIFQICIKGMWIPASEFQILSGSMHFKLSKQMNQKKKKPFTAVPSFFLDFS